MPPLISVVVPAYRSEATMRACLDSILSQSFDDIEVLVVNDCSPDGVRGIAEEYAARDPRLRIHNNASNQNLFDTRITGFGLASGQYVTVCDADDQLPPGALEAFARTAVRHKPDMAHGRTRELGGMREGKLLHFCDPFRVLTGPDFVRALISIGRGWNIWGKIFRTELVRRCLAGLPRRTGWFMAEDLLFCVEFGQSAKSYVGMAETVYRYRFPFGTGSAAKNVKNSIDQIEIMGFLWKNAEKIGFDPAFVPALRHLFCRLLAYDIRRYAGDERDSLAGKINVELGDAILSEVWRTHSSRTRYLFPGYHLGYLKKHGIREYICRMHILIASASRMGILGVAQRIRGK